jgi:asparaginyl-tRNA synthetase
MLIRLENIDQYVGQTVTVEGWLYDKTDKGKLQFLQVRDGTGIVQCVVFQKDVTPEILEAAKRLSQESSLVVTGVVRSDPRSPGIPGGFEIGVSDLKVIQQAAEYPITPKEHGVEFLMDNRHLWLRSSRQWAIQRIRSTTMRAIREWLDNYGLMEVSTPILTPNAAEGTSTLFNVEYFDTTAYLAQTGQLYNEANIFAFKGVYCFGPTFRAEKSKTRRHLTEFWMVEPEIAFCDLDRLLEIEEQFVSHIVQTVLKKCAPELKVLDRDVTKLQNIVAPFPRIRYDEAIERLKKLQAETTDPEQKELLKIEWGDDFGAPHETALTQMFDKPVFVVGYPTAVKAFYMEPWPDRPEACKSADLLAPEGYGEIIGGSERISDPEKLVQRIHDHHLPVEPYQWYIDLRKYGSVPHSGFGLGVERTVSWICGLEHIREVSPFPRLINRVSP